MAASVGLDRQPTLAGPRVALRPMREGDRDALFAVAADPLIWAMHPAHDRWQRPVFDRLIDDGLAGGGALTVFDAATGRVIGSSRYGSHSAGEREVEIGWTFLARSHWGGLYNREMKALMLEHAFGMVERVTFRIGRDNLRSRAAIEKIGAVLTDRLDVVEVAGRLAEHVVYVIDRDGWTGSLPLQASSPRA